MKKPQWITVAVAALLTGALYLFGRTVPPPSAVAPEQHSAGDGHGHEQTAAAAPLTIDSILLVARKQLTEEQVTRLNMLEHSISRGDVKAQQLKVYHQLSHFWGDTMRFFAPYAWYEAEAARLENSEKTLTFAAHLFLDNLQHEQNPGLGRWEALQAKDLFERSLKINPDNDSSAVGLGACYLFGNISDNPMEGLSKILAVVQKDSTNAYAQITLAKASLLSGQMDKAVTRLSTVTGLYPDNLEAILLLAEAYERKGEIASAIEWYTKSLPLVSRADARSEIEKRIADLKK